MDPNDNAPLFSIFPKNKIKRNSFDTSLLLFQILNIKTHLEKLCYTCSNLNNVHLGRVN